MQLNKGDKMPTVKRVTLLQERECTRCKQNIGVGEEVVKDRRDKKKGTVYYHTECPEKVA